MWRIVDPLVAPPVLGVAITAMIAGAWGEWLKGKFGIIGIMAVFLIVFLILPAFRTGLRGQAWRRLLPITALVTCPVLGYLLGGAAAQLAGGSGLTPAPLYGTMLGAVLAVVLWGPAWATAPATQAAQATSAALVNRFPLHTFGVLLASYTVQKEIQLTEEQRRRATEVARPIADKYYAVQQQFGSTRLLEKMPELLELQNKIREEIDMAVANLLGPVQLKRYRQIQLQQNGIRALSDPEVEAALQLNDDQKNKINAIDRQLHQEFSDMPRIGLWNFRAYAKTAVSLRKEAMAKVVSVLNDEQKKAWKELTGEPVEIRYQMPITEMASKAWKRITGGWSKRSEPRP